MSSRKKLTISLTVVALVVVAAVVAVVGVFAATQQSVQSTISITFKATDISGSIAMKSQVQAKLDAATWESEKTSTGTASHTFAAQLDDTTTVTGSFGIGSSSPVEINGREEVLIIEYSFTRDGDVDYGVKVTFKGNSTGEWIGEYYSTEESKWVAMNNETATPILTSVDAEDGATILVRIRINPANSSKELTNSGLGFFVDMNKDYAAAA